MMRIGVIGLGSIGSRHYANLKALGHQVVGHDTDAKKKSENYEIMFSGACEAVIIATPTACHERDLDDAIDYGLHVLIEKPIGLSDVKRIADCLESAKSRDIVVMMGNNLRFNPCTIAAKGWIEKGLIGTPRWAHFCCAQATSKKTYKDDGVILCTGAHEVDLAMHLLGPAKCVSAYASICVEPGAANCGINDIAEFVLEHESGCISSFSLNYIAEDYIREAWIVGEKKNIALDLVGRKVSFGKMIQGYPGDWNSDYIDEVAAFVDRCQGKDAKGATGADGLAVLEVLLDVRKKAGLA